MSAEKFLLVDDNILLRSSLARLIGLWRPNAVVAEASNGQEGIQKALEMRPDVILMDIRMPVCNGVEATRAIKASLPETTVIMLTVSDKDEDLFEGIRSGAHGYLLKNMRPEELFERLEDALNGEAVIDPTMAKRVLHLLVTQAHRRSEQAGQAELTPREVEVLEAVGQGATNREIADQLVITVGTVKNHIHNILDKLHLKNRTQAANYARMRRLGL